MIKVDVKVNATNIWGSKEYIYRTSNWARATCTCEILKLQNMDEDRCYVQLYFYDKLSSLKPSACPIHP
jgi:hypothetical protein